MIDFEILSVKPASVPDPLKSPAIKSFGDLRFLIQHITNSDEQVEHFDIFLPSCMVVEFVNDPVYRFKRVRVIYVYGDANSLGDVKSAVIDYEKKLQWVNEQQLQSKALWAVHRYAVAPDIQATHTLLTSITERIRQSSSSKRPSSTQADPTAKRRRAAEEQTDSTVESRYISKSRFLCTACASLITEPHQLECGDRICGGCVRHTDESIKCARCNHVSTRERVRLDQGLNREMERLEVHCTRCNEDMSLKQYKNHLEQVHGESTSDTVTISPIPAPQTEVLQDRTSMTKANPESSSQDRLQPVADVQFSREVQPEITVNVQLLNTSDTPNDDEYVSAEEEELSRVFNAGIQ